MALRRKFSASAFWDDVRRYTRKLRIRGECAGTALTFAATTRRPPTTRRVDVGNG